MKIKKGTILLDLTKSENELWKEVHKKNRWSINKARKNGVITSYENDKDKCYELYKEVCKRNFLIPNSKEKVFKGYTMCAYFMNKLVAFSVVNVKDDIVTLSYNATDYNYKDTQANVLLYWNTILWSKTRIRYKTFSLGGIDLNAKYRRDNDRFKQRWGGKLIKIENDVTLLQYIWWKYLRHITFIRKLKYKIQLFFKPIK